MDFQTEKLVQSFAQSVKVELRHKPTRSLHRAGLETVVNEIQWQIGNVVQEILNTHPTLRNAPFNCLLAQDNNIKGNSMLVFEVKDQILSDESKLPFRVALAGIFNDMNTLYGEEPVLMNLEPEQKELLGYVSYAREPMVNVLQQYVGQFHSENLATNQRMALLPHLMERLSTPRLRLN